eukprot:gnl/Carplike_NY0171/4624_a6281_287.p1 GENE.gnl/Carplike_NY0171/4624_a6281_287~~gnl/Carplike_NY0171/4624_a6281_287.p1  ORF type:complete len:409 (+),score=75.10 gnl/Carplike_NY0171/4624_a6281_287:6-1232(+)
MERGRNIVVLDNGYDTIKAGFLEGELNIIPAVIGIPRYPQILPSHKGTKEFYGEEAIKYAGICQLKRIRKRDGSLDIDILERLWKYIFTSILDCDVTEVRVIVVERIGATTVERKMIATSLLVNLEVDAICFQCEAALPLFAHGKYTGIVISIGETQSSVVPVIDGYVKPDAVVRSDIGGQDLTNLFARLLRISGKYSFSSHSDLETCKQIKELSCSCLSKPIADEIKSHIHDDDSSHIVSIQDLFLGSMSFIESKTPQISSNLKSILGKTTKTVSIGSRHYECGPERLLVSEALFDPSLCGKPCLGIADAVFECVDMCDASQAEALLGCIVCSGGGTCFDGFGHRLLQELNTHKRKGLPISVHIGKNMKTVAWKGGSVIGGVLEEEESMWILKGSSIKTEILKFPII